MEFVLSERGKQLILHSGYTFYKDKETLEGWKWRCTVRKCLAKLYVDNAKSVILRADEVHNHSQEDHLSRKIISNSVKRKATENLSERPTKLIREEICRISEHHSRNVDIRDIQCIRNNVYRARRKILPPLPKTIADVHTAVSSLDIKTNRGENMLLMNDSSSNIICFSTDSNLQYLCSREKIFIDGTFSFCPKFFCQLFTLHTLENGHYIPLVFFLLPNKTTMTYQKMFQMLLNCCVEQGLEFRPVTVVCDFEAAIHSAVKIVWPDCSIVGCRFHLTQSWWRHIQKLGLSNEYKEGTSEIGQWINWLFGLPFLDPNEVGDSFVEDFMSIQPNDHRVQKLCDYLTDNYIADYAKFDPSLWASSSVTADRTTNSCESFHSKFNASFLTPHPNIYIFVDVIKQIQVDVYVLINSVNEAKKVFNRRYKQRKEICEKFLAEYKEGLISRMHMLKCLSHHSKKREGKKTPSS